MNFSNLSVNLTKNLKTETKKNEGIFFTHPIIVSEMITYIKTYFKKDSLSILEPSCGSGEILTQLIDSFPNSHITGVEKNEHIFRSITSDKKMKGKVDFVNKDFMRVEKGKYDLIIGNPPYFVIDKGIYEEYDSYFNGRPNIFGMFIIHSLKKLNKGGILAFVIPNSIFNCSYYKGVRKYIYENYKVLNIVECGEGGFIETEQKTNVIYIMSSDDLESNIDFYFMFEDNYIINTKENISTMKEIQNKTTTLEKMNFSVFNGNLVWNQEKDCLTNDMDNIRVIYSSDITENVLKELNKNYIDNKWNDYEDKLKNNPTKKSIKDKISKKHYVYKNKLFRKHALPKLIKHLEKTLIEEEKLKGLTGNKLLKQQEKIDNMKSKDFEKEIQYGMLLVINRGYGNTDYNLNYAMVDIDEGYYLENHVLGIKYNGSITKEELSKYYNSIIKSFQDERTLSFLNSCMGNNAVNTTELEKLLPIFI